MPARGRWCRTRPPRTRVAGRCAPSYALRAGLLAGFSNSVAETSLIGAALLRGWAVTVPDYEGPQSEFLVSGVQARAVLDGIRATRAFTPAGVSTGAPIGVWGYSGGSLATITAAQLQPSYASDVHLTGIAVGGLVADIRRPSTPSTAASPGVGADGHQRLPAALPGVEPAAVPQRVRPPQGGAHGW